MLKWHFSENILIKTEVYQPKIIWEMTKSLTRIDGVYIMNRNIYEARGKDKSSNASKVNLDIRKSSRSVDKNMLDEWIHSETIKYENMCNDSSVRINNKDNKLLSNNKSRISNNNLIEQKVIKQIVGEESLSYKKLAIKLIR